jgi:hypothetical protein
MKIKNEQFQKFIEMLVALNNTKRIIVRVLDGASLNSLSVAWISRWGSHLKVA